jgi:Mrp family chromosome partitioning ATPase
VGCVALAGVVAGVFLLTRDDPKSQPRRFSSSVALVIATASEDAELPAPDFMPRILLTGQSGLAMSGEVRRAALPEGGGAASAVTFDADVEDTGRVRLTCSATDPRTAEQCAARWAPAFLEARKKITGEQIRSAQRSAVSAIESARARLRQVDRALLTSLDTLPNIDLSNQDEDGIGNQPTFQNEPLEVALLAYERGALQNSLRETQADAAELAVRGTSPEPFAEVIGQGSPFLIATPSTTESVVIPVLVILGVGLLCGLALAIGRDRFDRSVRTPKQAANAFKAPVLGFIPASFRTRGFSVLTEPESARTEAFRSLAATAVATDRLPSAVMVTSPDGSEFDVVAANFAAALADLGVRTALVGTSPRQKWFLEPFDVGEHGLTDLPELLSDAHHGRLDGQIPNQLGRTDASSNLLLVPPGDATQLRLPLDGLPPMLESLAAAGVDVTVIAGPPLLDDADATIVAWATRSVLWVAKSGETREDRCVEAARRLELAGVTAFGVAVVGGET